MHLQAKAASDTHFKVTRKQTSCSDDLWIFAKTPSVFRQCTRRKALIIPGLKRGSSLFQCTNEEGAYAARLHRVAALRQTHTENGQKNKASDCCYGSGSDDEKRGSNMVMDTESDNKRRGTRLHPFAVMRVLRASICVAPGSKKNPRHPRPPVHSGW